MNAAIEWTAAALVVIGGAMCAKLLRTGFVVLIISNILWGYTAYTNRLYGLLTLEGVLVCISIAGWYNWGRRGL